MGDQILMESLAKFQRGKPGGLDLSLSPITRGTEQASRFHRIMAVVGVVAQFFAELAMTYTTAILLRLDSLIDHLRSHTGFSKTLVIGAATSKFLIRSVALILSIPVNFLLFLATLFSPHTGVLNPVRLNFGISVIRGLGLRPLGAGAVFGSGNAPSFSLFFRDRLARSATCFRLFHGHDNTMTTREIGVIL